jgi:hypothetical protein
MVGSKSFVQVFFFAELFQDLLIRKKFGNIKWCHTCVLIAIIRVNDEILFVRMVELISDDSFVGVLLYIENLLKINFELEN